MRRTRELEPTMWTMRNGNTIAFGDMSDGHLRNAIALIERAAEQLWHLQLAEGYAALCTVHGEMAEYYLEGDVRRMEEDGPDPSLYRGYKQLVEELTRRRLS